MAEIKDPRGKHLLGEAVRLLVQSGATGVSITDFINEYSEVLNATLAAPPEPAQTDVKAQVKEALREALQELAPPARRTGAGLRKQIALYINGAKTSVALRKDLLESAINATGDAKKARQLIQDFAASKPHDATNRTAWIEQQLQRHLVMVKAQSTLAGQSTH